MGEYRQGKLWGWLLTGQWRAGLQDYRLALPGWVTVDLSGVGENLLMAWRMGGR